MRRLRRMFFKARSKQNLNCQDLFIYVKIKMTLEETFVMHEALTQE
jgi:hypothetical protein